MEDPKTKGTNSIAEDPLLCKDASNHKRHIIKKKVLGLVASLAIIFYVSAFGIYAWYFGDSPIIASNELWGQFGDYIGGVLNPLFALLAFLALLYTITQTQEELKLTRREMTYTREELAQTAKAATQQVEHFEREAKKNDLMKIIDLIHNEINSILAMDFSNLLCLPSVTPSHAPVDSPNEHSPLGEILTSGNQPLLETMISQTKGKPKVQEICWLLATKLSDLSNYVCEYENLSGNIIVSDFFKRKYYEVACELDRFEYYYEDDHRKLFGL